MLRRHRYWALEGKCPVRAITVVVSGELPEDGQEVSLVDDDDMVQAFPSNGPDDPFRDRVGVSLQLQMMRTVRKVSESSIHSIP